MWKDTIKKQSRDMQQKLKERDERLNTTVEKLNDVYEYVADSQVFHNKNNDTKF